MNKAPTTQVTESQLTEEIVQAIENLDRQGLVDLANTLLGLEFELEDVEWLE